MKKVMVFGTFDNLHDGHRDFFRQAKEQGDFLIAVIGRDRTVKEMKGHEPLQNEEERLTIVKKDENVDSAVLGDQIDRMAVVKEHKPDLVCFGYDQYSFTKEFEQIFPNIPVKRLEAFKPERYKSSNLRQ